MPAVYDDEKEKTGIKPHHDGSHDDLGMHPERREAEAKKLDDLYNAESAPTSGPSGDAEDKEKDRLDDQVGAGYTDAGIGTSRRRLKGRLAGRRKQSIIAGSLVTIAVGAGGLGFLAAPNLIVNHLRELLLGKVSELQIHQTRRYRRAKIRQVSDMFTRDGRRASRLLTEMETRGYRPMWDGDRLRGFVLPDGSGTIGFGTINHIEEHLNRKHPLRSARWKTKQMNATYDRYNIPRKSVVFLEANNLDESIDRVMNRKIAEGILSDDPASTRYTDETASGEESAEETDARKERNARAREMVESDGALNDVREKIKAGTPLSELDPDERAILRIGLEFDDELVDLINNFADVGVAGRIKGLVGSAALDIADKICTVRGRLRAASFAARVYRARALMQYTSIFVSASDQTRTGKVDSKLMNELMRRITALDGNDMPLGAASGMSRITKGTFSKSRNDASKTPYSVDGSLTGIAKVADDVTKNIPGTSAGACSVWQNPFVQIGGSVLEIGIGILTGGSGKAGTTAAGAGVKEAIKAGLRNMISRQTARSLALTAAVELSFEGFMALLQIQAEKALSLNFTGQEKGAELGEILAGGAGTLNKQRSLQAGMVPATSEQIAEAQAEFLAWKKEEAKNHSFFTRVFDYNNYDSLAFSAATSFAFMPTTPQSIGLSIGKRLNDTAAAVLSNPTSIFASIGILLNGKANAQSNDEISYDSLYVEGVDKTLATDTAGNLVPIMRTDIENIDPEENIRYLAASGDINDQEPYEPKSERFKNHRKNCVEDEDTLTIMEKNDQTNPEFDCLAQQEITKRFKAHLAYLDMVDGIDAWLFPEELATGGSNDSGSGSADPTIGDVSEPSFASNPNVAVDGSPPGPHRASNCTGTFTPGAASLKAVILEKWQPPVTSIGGYACRKNTASPGTSIHGLGRALDVMIDGTTPEGLAKGNEIRNWVINNAAQLGVQRVIWDNHTWAANRDGWRPYTGPNPHTDHLHIEINLEASTKGNLGR